MRPLNPIALSKPSAVSSQPRFSVLQFVIPRGRKPVAKVLAPKAIGGVIAGTRQASKYGGASTFNVALSPSSSHEKTRVGLMKFDITGLRAGKVRCVGLGLEGLGIHRVPLKSVTWAVSRPPCKRRETHPLSQWCSPQ